MIPATTTRVAQHTSSKVNQKIRELTERHIHFYGSHPEAIDERLKELDREWDIERLLEYNGSTLLLFGVTLGLFVSKKWFIVPLMVGGFCLQHAVQGWCPPVEVFRRLGVRTAREIEEERLALKSIRGDFRHLEAAEINRNYDELLEAVRR